MIGISSIIPSHLMIFQGFTIFVFTPFHLNDATVPKARLTCTT